MDTENAPVSDNLRLENRDTCEKQENKQKFNNTQPV